MAALIRWCISDTPSMPGPTGSTASGVPMLVDYVAVYTAGGGTTPPPAGHTLANANGLCLDVRSSGTANGTRCRSTPRCKSGTATAPARRTGR
jgi:hypothetical protein